MKPDHVSSAEPGEERSLHGMRIWITGASRGLGRAISADLSASGAYLALTARSSEALKDIAKQCRHPPLLVAGSVADTGDVAAMVEVIQKEWGGLDAVVHCAGISPVFRSADELDIDTWRDIIDVNLTGTFLICQAGASLMSDGGSIITMSSVHARSGAARLAAYSATKGAVESLTRALALDWAPRGIRVNCLAPGYFETDMTEELRGSDRQYRRLLEHIPAGQFGVPAQIVGVVRLLVGSGGSYINGAVLPVDGGWTAM